MAGIAAVFLLICTIQLSMGMWHYHTLAYAVHETSRFIAPKGIGCTKNGSTCKTTVGGIAQKFLDNAVGIASSDAILTLTTNSLADTVCNPVSSCLASTTVWPPSGDNTVGSNVTVSAQYQFKSSLVFFWPGKTAQKFGAIWFPASSTQTLVF